MYTMFSTKQIISRSHASAHERVLYSLEEYFEYILSGVLSLFFLLLIFFNKMTVLYSNIFLACMACKPGARYAVFINFVIVKTVSPPYFNALKFKYFLQMSQIRQQLFGTFKAHIV